MWWVVSEFEYDRDPTMGMVSAEEFNAMAARAEKAEADLARAVEERDAALVLLKTLGAEHGRAWLSTASEAAFKLLRERGLLGGER